MDKQPKSGVKTTEFYLTVASYLVGGLVLFGVLSNEEATSIVDAITVAVGAVAGLAMALAPLWKYIESRTRVKEAEFKAGLPEE